MNKKRVSHTITPNYTGWESKVRYQRMRKLLYKVADEYRYIFPHDPIEDKFFNDGRKVLGDLLNLFTDYLGKSSYNI